MAQETLILAIDQGTTSSRAIVFDALGGIRAVAQQEFPQYYPDDGWVEHDAEEIWGSVVTTCRQALDQVGGAAQITTIGITNQRETTLVWNRRTGVPVHKAIVWQDRRTASLCDKLKADGNEALVKEKTGLVLDPYFSASKIAWLLDNVEGARNLADAGDLAFGTVDSFLIWRLTDGNVHATDATNAARTSLYNIHTGQWDNALLDLFNVPRSLLPEVKDSAADFGTTARDILGASLPLGGVAGDQQAALFGQACFAPGMLKSTYGTGCFVVLNTGDTPITSNNGLLTTIGYQLGGKTTYALEGSIFIAGSVVKWLRDGLGIIKTAGETENHAAALLHNHGVYLVPAFTGLGAPHWRSDARGALVGLTQDVGPEILSRAALESVAYQTRDLFKAMADDGVQPATLRVDGGMVVNNWLLQFLSDILNVPVERPMVTETTALGAAYLAGLQAGIYNGLDDLGGQWALEKQFSPAMNAGERKKLVSGWHKAVERVLL